MPIEVASEVIERMLTEAEAARPGECCGILLGEGNRITAAIAAKNVHSCPQTHFEIDPQVLIDAHRAARADGPQVVGYYHSHPLGQPEPSATDAAMASGDGRIWAIIAGKQLRMWRDLPDGFTPLSYDLAE